MSTPTPPKKLLDQVRDLIRLKHYSIHTEEAYTDWIKRFILFHGKRHPQEMGSPEIEAFLTHLAVDLHVAAATQNQALCALLFLYREVLRQEVDASIEAVRAKKPRRLPVVLTRDETTQVIRRMGGTHQLMAQLMYGSGLRLMECVRLRVKDLDFAQRQIVVRDGKGQKDRVTMLPASLIKPLQAHLVRVKALHRDDLAEGYGTVYLPFALERKYPNANREWGWQYVFPARERSADPRSGQIRRHHTDPTGLQKAVKRAVVKAGLTKAASCHTFRHSFGRPFGRLVNTSMDVTRYLERVFSPWRWREPSTSLLVSFQGT